MKAKVQRFKDFNHSFNFYDAEKYKKNEYLLHLKHDGKKVKVPTRMINTFIVEQLCEKVIDLGNGAGVTIVTEEAVKRFHPNQINNKEFWLRAHDSFPLLSVCGGECRNINEANKSTLQMSIDFKLYPFLLDLIEKSNKSLSILEIGCGFGNVFNELKDRCEYIGIDYRIHRSLKKYKNFIEINESGIPEYLRDDKFFDVIYSVNVLQHCSQKDRFDYFKQGYSALKAGGYFIFSCMLMNKQNENEIYWGVKDNTGRGYLHFFNQLTECDWDYELFNHLQVVGYKPINGSLRGNFLCMIIQKPK